MNLPNMLTLFRVALVPVFALFFYLPHPLGSWGAASIFALASITDWLDGYLARKWNQTSQFGAFLDPVADKLLVVTALVLLVSRSYLPYISLPAVVMVGRELVVCAVREWMADLGKKSKVKVVYIAKFKTAFQFIAVIMLLAFMPTQSMGLIAISYTLLYIAAILTLWTLCIYIKALLAEFKFKKEEK